MCAHMAASQTAKKAKGICSVCHAIRKLHQSDGMGYRHGHRDDPYLGSNRSPLSVVAMQAHTDSASTDAVSTQSTSTPALSPGLVQTAPAHSYAHPCFQGSLIKHIPRGLDRLLPTCSLNQLTLLSWIRLTRTIGI